MTSKYMKFKNYQKETNISTIIADVSITAKGRETISSGFQVPLLV